MVVSAAHELGEIVSLTDVGDDPGESLVEAVAKASSRPSLVRAVDGYAIPQAFVIYVNEAADKAGYVMLDIVEMLRRYAVKNYGENIVIDVAQSFARVPGPDGKAVKGPDGKPVKGDLLATRVFIDTPASRRKVTAPKRAAKKKAATSRDLPAILRAMHALKLDEEFVAEAKELGADVTELARDRTCAKYGVSVETLREWYEQTIGK